MGVLEGQVVIVTGGGSGIGRTAARVLLQEGARVALLGRREEPLRETAATFPDDRVLVCPCDVTDRAQVNDAVACVLATFGRVDILINNAGVNVNPRATATVDPDAFDRVVDVNLTGTFNMTRAVLATMREAKSGLVINVASIAGIRGGAVAGTAYVASKHGVAAMVHVLNNEENENGIRACAICPGEVNTEMIMMRPVQPSEERRQQMLQPEDVAAAILFVASMPARAVVPVIVIKPTYQPFA